MRVRSQIAVLLLLAFVGLSAQSITVQVEAKEVEAGEESYLRVICNTDRSLSGLSIPLTIGDNPDLVVDSVSFVFTIAVSGFRLQSQITDANRTGFVSVIPKLQHPMPTFSAPGGEICRIHFRTSGLSSSAFVPVDTFYHWHVEGSQVYYELLDATDQYGTTLLPAFVAGGISIDGKAGLSADEHAIPGRFALGQNFPNPFNPNTQIEFWLDRPEQVRLDIFDISGRLITTLTNTRLPAGRNVLQWDAKDRHRECICIVCLVDAIRCPVRCC